MRILWIIPLIIDTANQFTSRNELARALSKQGHTVSTVVAYRNKRLPLTGFTSVKYIKIRSRSIQDAVKFRIRLIKEAVLSDADVIYIGNGAAFILPFVFVKKLWKTKQHLVMDIRSVVVDKRKGIKGYLDVFRYNIAIRFANIFCDGITVITTMLADTVRPKLTRIRHKIGVWTSGVDLNHFKSEGGSVRDSLGLHSKEVIIHHGVLSPNRGLQNVIKAVDLLRYEKPNLHFLLVGEGDGRNELEQLTVELNLLDKVTFTGKVDYEDIPQYIRSADLAILPFPNITWWAVSSPLKLMEYLAMGTPVLATDIPAHKHVSSITGGIILTKNNSPEILANAIKSISKSKCPPVSMTTLKATITWEKQAENLVSFFNQLDK